MIIDMVFSKGYLFVAGLVGIFTLILSMKLFFQRQGRKVKLPPGPKPLPIIGNMHQFGDKPHISLWHMAQKYGPIMYLKLGTQGVVVASTAEAAEEFVKVHDKAWAGRPVSTNVDIFGDNLTNSIAWAPYGPYWRHLRKIITTQLLTTKRFELFRPLRTDEINQMVKSIKDDVDEGKVVELEVKLSHFSFNNITRMLLNKRFFGVNTLGQKDALRFKHVIFKFLSVGGTIVIGDYIPWLKWVSTITGFKRYLKKVKVDVDDMLQEFLEVKKNGKDMDVLQATDSKTYDQHRQDFVDILLQQPTVDGTECLSDTTIKAVIQDMLIAGTETSSNTMEWAIAELIHHPEYAKKLHAELDNVVGRNRLVNESDIPNLPYLNAVVKEALRFHPPAPLNIPHNSLEDTTVLGFDLPANTQLFINIYAIQRDPKWWEKPLEFDPERFINNPEINATGTHFQLIPFGAGRRQCAGMALGMLFMQIGLARLMQSFEFTLPAGQDPAILDMSEHFGFTTVPRKIPLQVICKPRLPMHLYQTKP